MGCSMMFGRPCLGALCITVLITASVVGDDGSKILNDAIASKAITVDAATAERHGGQLEKFLVIKLVDTDGQPIAHAEVTPWALRSSQGHGRWDDADNDRAEMPPRSVKTNDLGIATVAYPFYRDAKEKTRTFAVSLNLKHPRYAARESLHIDVPIQDAASATATMQKVASLKIIATVEDGTGRLEKTDIEELFVIVPYEFSGQDAALVKRDAESITLTGLCPGDGEFLVARIDGGKATHFSDLQSVTLEPGKEASVAVRLIPSVSIKGNIDETVPRPVQEGRVSAMTVRTPNTDGTVSWHDWAAVSPEGEFTIEHWPATMSVQMIGLSKHHVAKSGTPPENYPRTFDAKTDGYQRPQVFTPAEFHGTIQNSIELAMEPLIECRVKVIDLNETPLANLRVAAWPNVGWWNWGSQVYAATLVRSVAILQSDNLNQYWADAQKTQPYRKPADQTTGDDGIALLRVPYRLGRTSVGVYDDKYALPIVLGWRDQRIRLVKGETSEVTMRVVPNGTDLLGDYDKLAGIVFGCSTREGKRICALPKVREKMNEFAERLRQAKDPSDPAVLSEAYQVVADAFENANDPAEASKWRRKATAEKAKL